MQDPREAAHNRNADQPDCPDVRWRATPNAVQNLRGKRGEVVRCRHAGPSRPIEMHDPPRVADRPDVSSRTAPESDEVNRVLVGLDLGPGTAVVMLDGSAVIDPDGPHV